MEHHGEPGYGGWSPVHEYPDPDCAAFVTNYPWIGKEDDCAPRELPEGPGEHWAGSPADQEDDIISSGDSEDSTDSPESFNDTAQALASLPLGRFRNSGIRAARGRGSGRRGRRGGVGRGGKGVKRGQRKAIEPTEEFKALQCQATLAFVNQNNEEAEELILQAIQINPEIFEAYNLLTEIHISRGDLDKAIGAAWTAAHTKQRDPEIWSKLADLILERDSDERINTLKHAVYCINRIINLDKYDVQARYRRARLYQELGYIRKAVIEYEELIKQLPHDPIVLRHLAELYIQLGDPERALEHYRSSIAHYQAIEPSGSPKTFGWSDINIVAELYGFQERFDEGIIQMKSLSRWLLGRKQDLCWETFNEDDREWDLDDRPRRNEVLGFVPGDYDASSYGDGLPLDLRIKLGIFRLKARSHDHNEAIKHFEWLDSEDDDSLSDCADLFRDAANALKEMKLYHEALRYYQPLQRLNGYDGASYYFDMASCYKALGLKQEAERCYRTVIEQDNGNYEARVQLSAMHQGRRLADRGDTQRNDGSSTRRHQSTKHSETRLAKWAGKLTTPEVSTSSMLLAPRAVYKPIKHFAVKDERVHEGEIHSLFIENEILQGKARDGDHACKAKWKAATKTLVQDFRNNKAFYPIEKHQKFFGYSKEARAMAVRRKYELNTLTEITKHIYETADGQQIVVPDEYCGISFRNWLDVFLDYAIAIARSGDPGSAYDVITSAFQANVFHNSPESLFLIHVCWFTCSLIVNDDELLCNVSRWFMKEYQFVTDGYCLFSALNRLCDSENSWYNCGPSQKYVLRQLKAVDFSLLGDPPRKSLFQERASYSTKDSNGDPIRAEEMDIALLMLYGHILYAGKGYAYAVNYYLRALTLDPSNPTIKLALALGYLHHALKRQADNRHHILTQGLTLLLEYYDDRCRSNSTSERQEAEYNVAHAYHLLGLTHLAIPHYERCIGLSAAVQTVPLDCQAEDFAVEAAVNLQGHWAASGNMEKAQEVTERWLVIE